MSVDAAFIAAHFPDLPGVTSTAYVELKILEAKAQVAESVWLTFYDLGVAYLTAHLMLVQKTAQGPGGGATSGPVTSERVGDLSRNYGGSSGGSASTVGLDSTIYGKEYLRLLRIVSNGPIV
jgi:hypothetical protein